MDPEQPHSYVSADPHGWGNAAPCKVCRTYEWEAIHHVLPPGEAEKREGMDRVERHADDEFKVLGYREVVRVACRGVEWTTDDIWPVMNAAGVTTHNNKAMSGPVAKAARRGIIRKTGAMRESNRPEAHRNPKAVWVGNVEAARAEARRIGLVIDE